MAQNREPKSEQEILQSFQTQRNELRSLAAKIEELSADANEHGLVLKTLEPMEKDRKCFRLIGGVLVERTVADVAPSVKTNKDQLDLVCPLESKSPTGVNIQQRAKSDADLSFCSLSQDCAVNLRRSSKKFLNSRRSIKSA